MKRSEIVEKIESLLNSVDGDKVRISNKLLADLILGTVEELGMLPPQAKVNTYYTKNQIGLVTVSSNQWESE